MNMPSKILLLILLSCSLSLGAITERYVADTAAGDGTGSSGANAMSYTDFLDYMATGGTYNAAAGDRFNIKQGSYASRTSTTDTFFNGGSTTSPVIIRGYKTTIGDGHLGRTLDGAGPLTTTNLPVWTYTTGQIVVSGANILLESLVVNAAGNAAVFNGTGTNCIWRGCVVTTAATGTSAYGIGVAGARGGVVDCDISITNGGSIGGRGIYIGETGVLIEGNRVKSTAVGIAAGGVSATILSNLVYECGGIGISFLATANNALVIGNTIVSNGGDGIDVPSGYTVPNSINNNMITDNAGYGIDLNAASVAVRLANNRFRDNASGSINSGTDSVTAFSWGNIDSGTTGDQSTDYVDASTDDYRLVVGSPATSTGLPGLVSIGAYQRDQTSSGGGETSHTFAN